MTVIKNASLLVGGLLVLFATAAHAQTAADLYKAYDDTIGRENSNVNNGPAYVNLFRIRSNDHNFYADDFKKGSVVYLGQVYSDIQLKYDIVHDVLIQRPPGDYNLSIQFIKDNVESFTLDGKTFVNINSQKNRPPFATGFYEQKTTGAILLFEKYHKDSREIISGNRVYDTFTEANTYIVQKDGKFYRADSKRNWTDLFPEQKKRINEFYQKDRNLEKTDKGQFLTNLARFVDNFNANESK
jgi:hypothetical protein